MPPGQGSPHLKLHAHQLYTAVVEGRLTHDQWAGNASVDHHAKEHSLLTLPSYSSWPSGALLGPDNTTYWPDTYRL